MKKLEEMNLVDDFLMNSLISHKIYGEKASRYLLECILSKKIALHKMVTEVKCDREVGSAFMKSFEIEQRVRAEGRAEGRAEERVKTERERARAEEQEAKAEQEKKRADALQQRVCELEGKAEENADILLENVKSIMANLQLPLEQAMNALNLKEEDKAIVREKLK